MGKFNFSENSWDEYLYWQSCDKKTLKRINLLLKDISRNGALTIIDWLTTKSALEEKLILLYKEQSKNKGD